MTSAAPSNRLTRSLRSLVAALTCASLAGCGSWWTSTFGGEGAEVRVEGQGASPAALDGVLPYGAYATAEADHTLYVSDVPLNDLLGDGVRNGQFLHAQLLWIPLPGRTPVDETAMNLTLRYVVVSEGQVGIYGGGGFAWPSGTPGEEDLTLTIEGSSLSLLAKSDGFTDLLSPARLTGTITARFDAEETRRFRRGVSQVVTDALGTSRWVDAHERPLTPEQVVQVIALADAASASSASSTN